jgi:hypothetical protein
MTTEKIEVGQRQADDNSSEHPARSRTVWPARFRWFIHLGLLVSLAASLGTLQLLHVRNAIHADVGLVFAGLVLVHLAQRRHRIARMLTQLSRLGPRAERELRLLASDATLTFITINVVVSGFLDWGRGAPVALPLLPLPFDRWHLTSSVALVLYLVVHVSRRWKRIRRSSIR